MTFLGLRTGTFTPIVPQVVAELEVGARRCLREWSHCPSTEMRETAETVCAAMLTTGDAQSLTLARLRWLTGPKGDLRFGGESS